MVVVVLNSMMDRPDENGKSCERSLSQQGKLAQGSLAFLTVRSEPSLGTRGVRVSRAWLVLLLARADQRRDRKCQECLGDANIPGGSDFVHRSCPSGERFKSCPESGQSGDGLVTSKKVALLLTCCAAQKKRVCLRRGEELDRCDSVKSTAKRLVRGQARSYPKGFLTSL